MDIVIAMNSGRDKSLAFALWLARDLSGAWCRRIATAEKLCVPTKNISEIKLFVFEKDQTRPIKFQPFSREGRD
jgi:hypothetical protein